MSRIKCRIKPVGARFNQPLTYRFLMRYNQTLSTCFIVLSGMASSSISGLAMQSHRAMSGTKRKIFGAEFKAKVGLEAIHGVKTINQIAQQNGVHPVQVGQ